MDDEARRWVEALGLAPHPEGGLYAETFRAPAVVNARHGVRAASTAIYFLLPPGGLSALHRVRSDEVWHHYAGDALELHTIDAEEAGGAHRVVRLGKELPDERPQHVVSSGTWQAAVASARRFTLCGCTVAPGFDFADFEMPTRAELVARFPQHAEWVTRLTRAEK
jgi:predicted cupin superfamily sugar epimerase